MRTLFITGQALGHVGRALMVARELRDIRPSEIVFAGNNPGGHLERYVSPNGFNAISLGSTYAPLLHNYTKRLETAITEADPDIIVLDISPVPWLLYAKLAPVPQVYLTNYFVTKLGSQPTVQDQNFKNNKQVINETRKQARLHALNDVRELYERDLVILADPKEVAPNAEAIPEHYRISGPIWWEPESALPTELEGLDNLLYISMGSTGSNVPDIIIENISKHLDIKHIISTSAKSSYVSASTSLPIRYYSRLPGSKVLTRSTFVITQGGAGSSYQALGAGIPMGFWPTHLNHYLLGNRLAELGAGFILDADTIEAEMESFMTNTEVFSNQRNKFSYVNPITAARSAAHEISKLF